MRTRIYISEINPWWTIERQEAALADVMKGATVFIDRLDPRQRRAHRAEALDQRAVMLRPSTRHGSPERFYVASLAVLAWTEEDLLSVVQTIKERGSDLVSMSEKQVGDVVAAWKLARARARVSRVQLQGAAVSAANRRADSLVKWDMIKDRWHLKEHSGPKLLDEAKLTRNTVNAINNGKTREVLIAQHERRMKRRKV